MEPENAMPETLVRENIAPENTVPLKQSIGDFLGSEILTIHVGPSKTVFRVHKELLRRKVPYFAGMFRSQSTFSESQSSVINFPEDKHEDFKMLLSWLYQDKLPEMAFSLAKDPDAAWRTLWSFYTLADKFNVVEAIDKSMDTFLEYAESEVDWVLKPELLAEIYSSSPSGLRKLCAHSLAYGLTRVHSELDVEILAGVLHEDIELLRGVLKVFNSATGVVDDPSCIHGCDFHVHGVKSPCTTRDINEYNERMLASYSSPSPSVGSILICCKWGFTLRERALGLVLVELRFRLRQMVRDEIGKS